MLNSRSDWIDWYNSIEDLAKSNNVWQYCDPEGLEQLSFTTDQPSDSASKDTIQKFQSLQSIFDSKKKKYDKVSDRIDYTLIALQDSIQPNSKDQRQHVRTEFEKLRKGPGNTSLDKWLARWPVLVNSANRFKMENLSEAQICDAFIEACRDINPPFYNYMKSKDAQTESQSSIINQTAAAMSQISDALITALNTINPDHASTQTIDGASDLDDADDTPLQQAQAKINKVLRKFRELQPTMSDDSITIGYCIKQFRSMAPPSEKNSRGRAAYATLQGRKHTRDAETPEKEAERPKKKRDTARAGSSSSSQPTSLRDCVCGNQHLYSDCWYIAPAKAPASWTPVMQTQSKVISAISGSKRLKEKVEKQLSRNNITLPEFWPNQRNESQLRRSSPQEEFDTISVSTRQANTRASFATSRSAALSIMKYQDNDEYFRLDNCADTHVCNDRSRFAEYKPIRDETIRFGNSSTLIEGVGSINVKVKTATGYGVVQLKDVAYVPDFHWNLMSTHALEQQGLFFNTRTCWMEFANGTKAFEVTKCGAFRVVELDGDQAYRNPRRAAYASTKKTSRDARTSTASLDVWHARLGHIRKEAIQRVPHAVQGVQLSTTNFEREAELCQVCELSQAHRQILRTPTWKGSYPFEKVHLDLIDMDEAFNADSWIVHFYCDYAAYHISFNSSSKSQQELISVTKEFLAITNDNWGFTTRYIHSDREKGLGNEWKELVAARGITFTTTPPDTPEQNGLAERSGGVIINTARKLRIQSQLPHKLWPHIVAYATRLLNRIPVQRRDWKTPFEIVHSRKPDLSGLRIIGSRAYVLVKNLRDRPARAKLHDKALMGWLIGTEATNIYKVWIPASNRVITSRDVKIDEKVFYQPQQSLAAPRSDRVLVNILNEIDESDNDSSIEAGETAAPEPEAPTTVLHQDSPITSRQDVAMQVQQEATKKTATPAPKTQDVPAIRNRHIDATILKNLRSRSGRNVRLSQKGQDAVNNLERYTAKKARRQAYALLLERSKQGQQVAHAFASAQTIRTHRQDLSPPPEFWHQLKRHAQGREFRHAADAELESLRAKNTFELVDWPKDKQILPLKWVFTYKFDDAGYLNRHKARVCVRGDLQHNVSDDIYAATGAYRSLRILMALVAAFGLLCHQTDFKNAFTNAEMDEEVYTTCPPGYNQPGKVWKLRKALYGLRRSPKLWFNELASFLKDQGFNHCPDEPCILINDETGLILFIYVDDMLIIAQPESISLVKELKLRLNSRYGIKDLGEVTSFLNISIFRNTRDKKLWISQHGYIEKICTKFGIDGHGRMATTPLLSSYRPQKHEGQASMQQVTEMQEKVGSILYAAVVSRPDVAFSASQLSQFTMNPSPEHLRYANRVLSYLHATKYYAIEFSGSAQGAKVQTGDEEVCELSSDASFADDPETRKSTQGYLIKLFKGPIMWQSSKQRTVTTSTTEAELLSLSHTAKETIGLYRLFKQIQFDPKHQPRILCDNQQTIGLIQKDRPQLSSKLKHVDIHNLWLRQTYRKGVIHVKWVSTSEMPADGFTKPLSAEKHSQFVRHLGLVDITSQIDPDEDENLSYDEGQTSSEAE
uniref:CcxB n=1 Tax=Cochliobolus sativus TaxID=45130 RepID=A0A4D6Q5E2_COCSA|nr:CcxB [Bipolaris sorokiniana]